MIIYTAVNGYLDDIELDRIARFEQNFIASWTSIIPIWLPISRKPATSAKKPKPPSSRRYRNSKSSSWPRGADVKTPAT